MDIPKPCKVDLGNDKWTVKYLPKLTHDGKYQAVVVIKGNKEILVSLLDADNKKKSAEQIAFSFSRAITPIVQDNLKQKKDAEL